MFYVQTRDVSHIGNSLAICKFQYTLHFFLGSTRNLTDLRKIMLFQFFKMLFQYKNETQALETGPVLLGQFQITIVAK